MPNILIGLLMSELEQFGRNSLNELLFTKSSILQEFEDIVEKDKYSSLRKYY